jgi:hypothetical protein
MYSAYLEYKIKSDSNRQACFSAMKVLVQNNYVLSPPKRPLSLTANGVIKTFELNDLNKRKQGDRRGRN